MEFPRDSAGLATFDRADRKFVAVALAHDDETVVAVCVDSDWWDHRKALADAGVAIEFLCPEIFE
ncbi:MAG: hypothetical protein JOY73_08135 [Actinobacteria bacterium]|nr:hypothetical protein [Actinomycetota bacterium]